MSVIVSATAKLVGVSFDVQYISLLNMLPLKSKALLKFDLIRCKTNVSDGLLLLWR